MCYKLSNKQYETRAAGQWIQALLTPVSALEQHGGPGRGPGQIQLRKLARAWIGPGEG